MIGNRFAKCVKSVTVTTAVLVVALVGGCPGWDEKIEWHDTTARTSVIRDSIPGGNFPTFVRDVGETAKQIRIESLRCLPMGDTRIWQGADGDASKDSNWFGASLAPGTRATGTLTCTDQPHNTETVVIDGKTYTFQTTLTDVDGNIQIGGDLETSLANLVAAIGLEAGAGTKYAASTTALGTVTAVSDATTLTGTGDVLGTAGNSITTTDTLTDGDWGGATLSGAVNNWATDDETEFDGDHSNVSVSTGLNWGNISIDQISSKKTYRGDVGTQSNPLKAGTEILRIEGSGAFCFESQDTDLDKVIVDSINGQDALYIDGQLPTGYGDIIAVKAGHLIIEPTAAINDGPTIVATGSNARITMENPGYTIQTYRTIFANGARVTFGRYLDTTDRLTVGAGVFLDVNYSPLDGDVTVNGYLLYRPTAYNGYSTGLMSIMPGGTLDLSKLSVEVSMQIVLHPGCVYFPPAGGLFVTGSTIIDLREPTP